MATILIAGFAVFMFLGMPIGFAIALASLAAIIFVDYPINVLSQRMFTALDSFPLMAIPLFMLAGSLMNRGGITRRIISFALSIVGNIRGSLAQVVALSGIMMGGISGSAVADTAALGTIMIPEMSERGYDRGFSAALVAASGSIALILPPSIAIIIYAVTVQASIGDLFLAAIIPGLLIGFGFLIYSYFVARIYNYPKEGVVSGKEKWRRFREAIWALVMPIIIIFGIRRGVFTATEGGAVIVVYCFLIGKFVYGEIKWSDIPDICYEAALTTAAITIIIASTSLFSWLLSSEQIPQKATQALLAITDNKIALLLIINLILFVCGMFLDSGPGIMLIAPILAPAAMALGVHPVQFGLVMVINLTIGLLTPPVGTALFVASNVSGVPLTKLIPKMIPFWIIMVIVLMLVTYYPPLTMWVVK